MQPAETITCDGEPESVGDDCFIREAPRNDEVPEDEPDDEWGVCAVCCCELSRGGHAVVEFFPPRRASARRCRSLPPLIGTVPLLVRA